MSQSLGAKPAVVQVHTILKQGNKSFFLIVVFFTHSCVCRLQFRCWFFFMQKCYHSNKITSTECCLCLSAISFQSVHFTFLSVLICSKNNLSNTPLSFQITSQETHFAHPWSSAPCAKRESSSASAAVLKRRPKFGYCSCHWLPLMYILHISGILCSSQSWTFQCSLSAPKKK